MGVGGVPMVQGTELLSSLSRIQVGNLEGVTGVDTGVDFAAASAGLTNVLALLKQSSVGQSMGQVDAMTLNVVSLLFDKLFDDAKVPTGIKALAARLQIPMLKVAIADKALFSDNAHPARVHLDLLGELGARLPADFDDKHPVYEKLAPIELEIVEKFEDKVEIFIAGNEKLQAFVAEEDQRAAQVTDVESKRLEQLENLSAAATPPRKRSARGCASTIRARPSAISSRSSGSRCCSSCTPRPAGTASRGRPRSPPWTSCCGASSPSPSRTSNASSHRSCPRCCARSRRG